MYLIYYLTPKRYKNNYTLYALKEKRIRYNTPIPSNTRGILTWSSTTSLNNRKKQINVKKSAQTDQTTHCRRKINKVRFRFPTKKENIFKIIITKIFYIFGMLWFRRSWICFLFFSRNILKFRILATFISFLRKTKWNWDERYWFSNSGANFEQNT